jgi:activator of 2-hydroxyglutaryl-CoA dehydratase
MGIPHLGIDIGSVAIHAAVSGADDAVLWSGSRLAGGRPLAALDDLLGEVANEVDARTFRVGLVAGARNLLAAHCPDASRISEVVSAARGTAVLCPDALAAIEIGGQMPRWIELDPERRELSEFALSDLCAGAFLEQQAGRLQLSIEELAAEAGAAERGAAVAGRCAVFAKSDMIHLQQKGTPVDEIA